MIQTWSNLVHSNDDLFMKYDLVTHLALAMNTKVVHNDTLNMFKLFARSHNLYMFTLMIICTYTWKHEIIRMLHMF